MRMGDDVAALILAFGWVKSKSEARRLIKQGAVLIGRARLRDPFARLCVTQERIGLLIEQIDGMVNVTTCFCACPGPCRQRALGLDGCGQAG